MSLKELIESNHGKWWMSHQSRKECIYGSDGTGHDLVHPVDKLRSAFRNAYVLMNAILDMRDDLDIKILENKRSIIEDDETSYDIACIQGRKQQREIEAMKLQIEDREIALKAYEEHIQELLPTCEKNYQDFDSALSEIWATRIALSAAVKSHPLGQELKTAIMPENEKQEVLAMIGFPTTYKDPNGQPRALPNFNADQIYTSMKRYKDSHKKELS